VDLSNEALRILTVGNGTMYATASALMKLMQFKDW
jgi:hypothetical protein